jgi:TRAP-type C4-dicarboxylate transport system permease small subunit
MTQLFQLIRRVEAAVLAISILGIAVLIVLNVAARALTGSSIAATGEVCQFLILLVTFAGLSHAAGSGRHIRMTAFHDLLGLQGRRRLLLFVSAATALLLALLALYACHYVAVMYRLGSVSPVLQVPLFLVYACAPLGLLAATAQYVLAAIQNARGHEAYLSYDAKDEYLDDTDGEDEAC